MRLLSGEAKTLSSTVKTLDLGVRTLKAMVFHWAYDQSKETAIEDFEVRLIHGNKVLSDTVTSLANAGVMPGDEITVIGQERIMPDLAPDTDDEMDWCHPRRRSVSFAQDFEDWYGLRRLLESHGHA